MASYCECSTHCSVPRRPWLPTPSRTKCSVCFRRSGVGEGHGSVRRDQEAARRRRLSEPPETRGEKPGRLHLRQREAAELRLYKTSIACSNSVRNQKLSVRTK